MEWLSPSSIGLLNGSIIFPFLSFERKLSNNLSYCLKFANIHKLILIQVNFYHSRLFHFISIIFLYIFRSVVWLSCFRIKIIRSMILENESRKIYVYIHIHLTILSMCERRHGVLSFNRRCALSIVIQCKFIERSILIHNVLGSYRYSLGLFM